MNILVLGGAGFIGSALISRLKGDGHTVTSIDRYWPEKKTDVRCVTGDVFDESLLKDEMVDQDVVYHLVSTTLPATSNKSPQFDAETNIIGSIRILDSMLKSGVKHIIFASSGGTIYGIPEKVPISEDSENFPISAYGISKLSIEKYLCLYSYLHGIKATSLRISNPYGPGQDPGKGQGVCAAFIARALHQEVIEVWGDGEVTRDFIYIDDVVDALVAIEKMKDGFDVLNIGSGQGHSLNQVLKVIECELGEPVRTEFKPARSCDVPSIILNIQKAEDRLYWRPKHPFSQGIAKTITFMKQAKHLKGKNDLSAQEQ